MRDKKNGREEDGRKGTRVEHACEFGQSWRQILRDGEKWAARRMEWTSWLLRLYSVVISRKVTRIESRLSDTVLASLTIIHFCAKKKEKDFIQIEKWINFFAWKYQLLAERSSGSNSISTRVFKHGSITEVELGNGWKAVRLKLFQWQQVPLSARCL